ncbi:hypothetical protein HMPREF1544_05805 [Mucor circinelloides 1006PhL]|uniref:Protein EFR3 n=1 Tax=Mucor circinelloides f. circinelloides (strain 1006PhL) TaxID=1220926 RepID=S2JC96_MUCC1|nr:hypothetical protein HMPREF1544_05805 [Mucor circinelloides 1006PhL]
MVSCIPCVHTKHATLVNHCYPPVKDGSTIPRSSELSYLTFYASSKPAKLTKVGSFIQKRVEKDIRKGRKSQNIVSLQIIKALIQTCHRDLNIFSKYIVKILSLLLDTRDLEIIDRSCETFIVFSSYHDGSTLGVDSSFTTDYESLLKKFSGFCNYANEDLAFALKMIYVGHRAVQAAVTSGAIQSSNFKMQLSILFPPLIITIASKPTGTELNTSSGSVDIRESALDNSKVSPEVIESIAAHTISILFNKVTGPSVRLSLVPLFSYLDEKEKWWPPQLIVKILKLVLDSLQPQYRHLLVSDLLHHLNTVNKEEDIMDDKHTSLISSLDSILNANVPLVGISVLEVLNNLFTLLIKSTQYHAFKVSTVVDSNIQGEIMDAEKTTDHANLIQQGLVHCIGGLATQNYYDNQLNDMIGYLTSKLRTNTSLEQVDGMLIHDYRSIVLCCLDSVVQGSKSAISPNSSEAEIRIAGTKIPLDAWNPALGLLCDKNSKTRMSFAKCLYDFLQNIPPKVSMESTDKYPIHSLTELPDNAFVDRLIHTMLDWILITDFNITDLRFFYAFLCLLNRKFGVDATVFIVPLIFKIQQCIQENKITLQTRQYAIESALISWFGMVAGFYGIQPLSDYINTIKSKRGTHPDDLLLTESIDNTVKEPELFSISVDDAATKANTAWIDRSTVVELMSKEGNLRDETDTHGLDLEAKLFAEWGSDAFLRNDQTVRSRILVDATDNKPKLASPWEHAEMEQSPLAMEDKRNSIRVATLKEALVAQTLADEDMDTDSTQSNSLSAYSKPPPMRSNEVNALLTELNLPQHMAPSTVSLVNPPYKST